MEEQEKETVFVDEEGDFQACDCSHCHHHCFAMEDGEEAGEEEERERE